MLQGKQIDRLISKVMRLGEVYKPFLIDGEIFPDVYIHDGAGKRRISRGDKWGGEFEYATFSFTVPEIDPSRRYYLCADTGAVEHLVSVNGSEVGMLDHVENAMEPMYRVHRYLPLEGLKSGDDVCAEGYYSHTIPGTMPYDDRKTFALEGYFPDRPFEKMTLLTFYEPLKAFCEELEFLNSEYRAAESAEKLRVEKVYAELFGVLSLKKERPTEESLRRATEIIAEYRRADRAAAPYVGIIGHSHLDTAWLWTVSETRKKLHRTLSNAVTLLKRYDDYKFLLSSVLYLKWIEEDDPELFGEIEELVRQGRLEPNGGAWVECDCNLTSGEAICRQFLRGMRYTREKFGYVADAFWLPDTFGYSGALPQILRKVGIKYFLTTKLGWNDTNAFPYTSFIWKGIDGSEVLVHFNSTHTPVDPESVKKRLNGAGDKRPDDCVLMAYGYGDGGGGPSDETVRTALKMCEACSFADVEHTTVSEFMKKLERTEHPLYFGELYLELHRGTFTSGHDLKAYNRRLGEALHDLELISVFGGDRDKKKLTDEIYDTYLLNTFHDILPGSCIKEATDEALEAQRAALDTVKRAMRGEGKCRYFNTLAFERRELLPSAHGQRYTNAVGEEVALAPYEFPAFGYGKKSGKKYAAEVEGNTVRTRDMSVSFGNGGISSLIYRGRELCRDGMNMITFAEDVPYIYDNWDIDADYKLKKRSAECVGLEIISSGEYFTVVRATYSITGSTKLVTDIIVRHDIPLIVFDNVLTAGDDHILVKAEFDTTLFAPRYACETQFGYVERNAYPVSVEDNAKFEVCSHKWTDISEKGCGLSLLSDVKYGVSCDGKRLGITLHKSGTHPDDRADKGTHRFGYALYPHAGPLGVDTVKHGYAFNYRPAEVSAPDLVAPFAFDGGASVMLETVKFGEDGGTILRMYECMGATSTATVTPARGKAYLCDLLEDVIGEAPNILEFAPFEIKTLLIK